MNVILRFTAAPISRANCSSVPHKAPCLPHHTCNMAPQSCLTCSSSAGEPPSHLGNVVHDRDLELPVHEGPLWVWDLVIQHVLEEDRGVRVCVCMHAPKSLSDFTWANGECACHTYPERPPLSVLKHSEHALIKLHCAIKLSEVVIVDLEELQGKGKTRDGTLVNAGRAKARRHQINACVCLSYCIKFYLLRFFEVSIWVFQLLQNYNLKTQQQQQPHYIFVFSTEQRVLIKSEDHSSYLLVVERTADLEILLLPLGFNLIEANEEHAL